MGEVVPPMGGGWNRYAGELFCCDLTAWNLKMMAQHKSRESRESPLFQGKTHFEFFFSGVEVESGV